MSKKVGISATWVGSVLSHSNAVRAAFLSGMPSGWDFDLIIDATSYAQINNPPDYYKCDNGSNFGEYLIANNYLIAVEPVSAAFSDKFNIDQMHDAGIYIVAGHDADDNNRYADPITYPQAPPYLYSAITCGWGEAYNTMSWGPGLELFDFLSDWLIIGESIAVGVVASKLAAIIDAHPEYNYYDARQHLRQICSLYPLWTEADGFGRPDITKNINTLDLGIPTEIIATKSLDNLSVILSWVDFKTTRWMKTRVTSDSGEIVYEGSFQSCRWFSDIVGSKTFTIQSVDVDGNLSAALACAKITVIGLLQTRIPAASIEAEAAPQYDGYCTQDGSADGDIAPARISLEQLRQLTGDSETIVIQSVIDEAIEWADDHINSYAAKKYIVPMNPVPSKVRSLSADLATFKLFEKRSMNTGGDVPETYRKMFDNSDSFLQKVAAGKAVIDGAITPPASVTNTGGWVGGKKRIEW
jgi:phage gp36-like protein